MDLKTCLPAEISFFSEGKELFQVHAGGARLDVQEAGKGLQFCGIDVTFDTKMWDRIEVLDVNLADGSIFASITKPAGFDVLAPNSLANYKSSVARPLRIKVFLSPEGGGAGAAYRSLYLSPNDDTSWVERMFLPESALPCFSVINDEFVTLISTEITPRSSLDERWVVASIDELDHTQLMADANSKEEAFAAFAGDLFELPRGITVCYKVRVVKT